MPAMCFDSNALEMRTAEHCMYLTKICELLVCVWKQPGPDKPGGTLNEEVIGMLVGNFFRKH